MVEIDEKKQAYLMSRFPEALLFQDVSDVSQKFAPTADGGRAPVPEASCPKAMVLSHQWPISSAQKL